MSERTLARHDALYRLMLHLAPTDFGRRPACADAEDPEIFHPVSEAQVETVAEAKSFCAVCPVRRSCLEQALRRAEHGIWGGLTESERERLLRRRATQQPAVPRERDLVAEAVDLVVRARRDGGELSVSAATKALGVRYARARAAVLAARAALDTETQTGASGEVSAA
ncbi:hypothetical protein GCM10012275_63480 [Longimycelium tulufanense]|uniref:Transcriptional regulator WhiB n=1 Tax=Longimycelium tulufanense TaxID=907463 RepID=A0A8J3CKV1_9PSEU|nr:WhiB family transcriptional regulator [Longimycelium tulufanense]GGM84141.1 hypothetical protein GCM10012275_63480 [Longimycelium tulufanense]